MLKTTIVAKLPAGNKEAVTDALKALSEAVVDVTTETRKFRYKPLESFSLTQSGELRMVIQHVEKR